MRTMRSRFERITNLDRRAERQRSADVGRMRASVTADARQPFVR